MTIQNTVERLLENNQIGTALHELKMFINKHLPNDNELKNDLILISSRFEKLNRNSRNGIIDLETITKEDAFLTKGLLSILADLPKYSQTDVKDNPDVISGVISAIDLSSYYNSSIVNENLLIHRAFYGKAGNYFDVTQKLREKIKDNQISIIADNSKFGEPCYKVFKELIVLYSYERTLNLKIIGEKQMLQLPEKMGGFIFLGNYYPNKNLYDLRLLDDNKEPLNDISDVKINITYFVKPEIGVFLRKCLPNKENYTKESYKAIELVLSKPIPQYTKIRIVNNPIRYHATDFWVEIELC